MMHWPGFDSRTQRHVWVEFILFVFVLALRGFSLHTQVFSSTQKPIFSNSNSTRIHMEEEPNCGCATATYSYLILFYFIFNYLCTHSTISPPENF